MERTGRRSFRGRKTAGAGGRAGIISACLAVLTAGQALADTSIDPARQLMGRTTYPAKAWTIETEMSYNLASIRDESRDTAGHELGFDYGLTDRWSVETGIESREGPRRAIVYDRLAFGTRYKVLKRPFQLTPFVEYLPSLRQGADEWKLGLEQMKNYGNLVFQLIGSLESETEPDGTRKSVGYFHLGHYYRFGAGSMAGVMLGYKTNGESMLHLHYAGAMGKTVFLGFEPKIGLSRNAPDASCDFLLGIYFGSYGLLDWLIE